MKSLRVYAVICFVVLASTSMLLAQQQLDPSHFTLISFDPPGSHETHAFDVNDHGVVVGFYLNANNQFVGYVRFPNGKFVTVDPSNGAYNVFLDGINNLGTIAGYSFPPNSPEQTFFLNDGRFSSYNFPGAIQTQIDDINNNGDFAGVYVASASSFPGFIHLRKTNEDIQVVYPGAAATFIEHLNDFGIAVGAATNQVNPYGNFTGFLRHRDGTFETLTVPNAVQSTAYAINDGGLVVGDFVVASGAFHGLWGPFNHFKQFDYPGATSTAIVSVNNLGVFTGRYLDSSGFSHGFIAIPKGRDE